MLVDEKCIELAEHFLEDSTELRPETIQALAEDFQRAAEGFLLMLEEPAPAQGGNSHE